MISAIVILAACLTLFPLLVAAFFSQGPARWAQTAGGPAQLFTPCLVCLPYAMVAISAGTFAWRWFAVYAVLPILICGLLLQAKQIDPAQQGNWRDFVVLGLLGLAVDLRWFEAAWPPHLAIFNKILLLDVGIWGFLVVRQMQGIGFDLRLRRHDIRIGLREFLMYMPIALAVGLGIGFLHLHAVWPHLLHLAGMFFFTFLFIAVPEELFFRGWLQNLLERRLGRSGALLTTAVLFGLSHFNKRAAHFNWRYVLLAAIAGVFYGRAWRQERRVGASAITHACVDTVWSAWLR